MPTIDRSRSTRMSPPVGRKMPVTQLNSVVLPAPLGPMIPKICPGRTVSETSFMRDDAAEVHRDVARARGRSAPPRSRAAARRRRFLLGSRARRSPPPPLRGVGLRLLDLVCATTAAASPSVSPASASSAARCRLGISPCGRNTMIATSAAPKSSTRYSVIVPAWPPISVLSRAVIHSPAAASRRYSGR